MYIRMYLYVIICVWPCVVVYKYIHVLYFPLPIHTVYTYMYIYIYPEMPTPWCCTNKARDCTTHCGRSSRATW